MKELRKSQRSLKIAKVAISQSSGLEANSVIHCHISQWGFHKCEEQLEEATDKCLSTAEGKKLKSVAFLPFPSSRNWFPKQMAAQVALKTILAHFNNLSVSFLKNLYLQLSDSENIGFYVQQMAKLDTSDLSSGNGEGAMVLSPEQD